MFEFRRGILGVTSIAVLGLGASFGCGSDNLEDPPPAGAGGTGATGGAGGSGGGGGTGGAAPACKPTADVCYSAGPNGPGNECLAPHNNDGQDHVQIRAVWARSIAPKGNTDPAVYDILRLRSSLNWGECNMPNGQGGFMLLTDWDRSNPDKAQQTVRTGYAAYMTLPGPAPDPVQVKNDGLCMLEYTLDQAFDMFGALDLGARAAELGPLAFPWEVKPTVSKRVLADFDATTLYNQNPPAEPQVFIDEEKGYIHGYAPLSWVTVLDSRTTGIAIPMRAFDIKSTFNDNKFNCAGRFRADKLSVDSSCDSPAQDNPQWGCKDDAACPPAGYEDVGATGAGAGPNLVLGHFKIVDLERIFSAALGGTLCTTYPGVKTADLIAQGWAAATPTGRNCRGGSKWNPSLPNDEGLPPGDWCSRTNSIATATCHDAWRSVTFGAGQAFKIKAGTCPRGG
jgi:hypothetical protein